MGRPLWAAALLCLALPASLPAQRPAVSPVLPRVWQRAPDTTLSDALRLFRREHRHLAVVRGEDGAVQGIITLEDVLEQIVGAIADEQDDPEAG